MAKICFKCQVKKPLADFYRHQRMADGHLNKCKECTKKDTRDDYHSNKIKHALYEQKRFKDPVRKAKIKVYRERMKAKNPEKYRARTAVSNAVRDGRLVPQLCVQCGGREVQGHHHDYSDPLNVTWLCFACHRSEHGQEVILGSQTVRTASDA